MNSGDAVSKAPVALEGGDSFTLSGEERFHFDLKGWVCIPGVLGEDQIEACREYALLIHHHSERLEKVAREKPSLTGPLGDLLDHPVLAGILNEIIGPMSLALESETDHEFHAFRCESSFSMCLFRGVWNWWNRKEGALRNTFYSEDNQME